MIPRSELLALLADGVRFAPNYRPVSNSDHLPMTLAAMVGLGGSRDAVRAFRDSYIERLHEWQTPPEPVDSWQAALGDKSQYAAVLVWMQAGEPGEMLAPVLTTTLPGIAMEAFHPIIRLGYAVDFGSVEETAAALAYLVTAHREIPVSHERLALQAAVDRQSQAGDLKLDSGRFGPSVLALVENGTYPTGSAESLQEIAAVALRIYRSTRNFFALHLVTATQAIRVAVPPDLLPQAVASMSGALLASHLVLGSPACIEQSLPAPEQLDPEHAFKYVWACWSEFRAYGDPVYLEEIRLFREADLVPAWAASDLLRQTD